MKQSSKGMTAPEKFRTYFRTQRQFLTIILKIMLGLDYKKKASIALLLRLLTCVPGSGIEPPRHRCHRILSPACLPVPPPRQGLAVGL